MTFLGLKKTFYFIPPSSLSRRGDYGEIAPPHSYIDVRDFASARDLASHLLRLHRNDEEYLAHFRWRERYRVRPYPEIVHGALCGLCQRLHVRSHTLRKYPLAQWPLSRKQPEMQN